MKKLLIFAMSMMIIIIIGLVICKKMIKKQSVRDTILKVIALLTITLHYSSLWVDYLQEGVATVDGTMLFMIYPCNICMWMLLVVAFINDKKCFFGKVMIEFLAITGTICGMIGLFANEIFISNPSFSNYDSLKGLLSHSTMIFGTLYLLTQGYVKIETISMTVSTILGLLFFLLDGVIINKVFAIFGLPEVNAMYLLRFPIVKPFCNTVTLGLIGVNILFVFLTIYETLVYKQEERWYYKLKLTKIKDKENKE